MVAKSSTEVWSDFVSAAEEAYLVQEIEKRPWGGKGISPNPELRRCTQHYGYTFSYRYRRCVEKHAEMPAFLDFLFERFRERGLHEVYDLVIVNEYLLGEGKLK